MQFLVTIAVLWTVLMACSAAQDTIRWAPGALIGRRSIFDKTGKYIKYFKTTMTLGALPSPPRRVLFVWPGLLTENGDLVQSVAGSNVMGSLGNSVNCPNFERVKVVPLCLHHGLSAYAGGRRLGEMQGRVLGGVFGSRPRHCYRH